MTMATQMLDTPSDLDMVSVEEAASFRKNGFIVPKRGLDSKTTATLQANVEQVFLDNPDWHNLVRMPHVPLRSGQLEGVIGGEKLFEIAIHPQIIAAARALVGPDLIMWGGEIFAKPAGIGKSTPWHQDCYNPAVKAGPGREFARSVMIWIAVDAVDVGNGCLRFVPGSGRGGRIEHNLGRKANAMLDFEVDHDGIDFNTAVDAELPPGHFSGHDLFVVHGANANTSGRRRAGITFHYMSSEDAYDRSFGSATGSGASGKPAPLAQRPIWLVLGENRNPVNDFVTGHQNLEDLDASAEQNRIRLNGILNG
jgi:ectoine hydroxylase-related dioxygenase (phytanoyl-CoA dioxygenase family)